MDNANTFEFVATAIVMLGFITYRQTRWQAVRLAKQLRMPVLLAVAAVALIPTSVASLPAGWHLGGRDVALIAVELGLGLTAGILMGRWTEIRTMEGKVVSRVVGRGLAVWIGFIAIRVLLGVFGSALGAPLGSTMSIIFTMVVTVKVAQVVMVQRRTRQQAAQSPAAHEELASDRLVQAPRFPAGV